MEMNNEDIYNIRISGKANIPNALAIGHNYKLTSDCSITSATKTDNNDGTFTHTFKAEPLTVEITKDNGETIKAKDPRRNSVLIRNKLWKEYYNEGVIYPFEEVYDEFAWVVLSRMPELLKETISRLEEKHENKR